MRKATHINATLQSGGLSLHGYLGRVLGVGFGAQCFIITVLSAAFILFGSVLDGSLILRGPDVGLLEHPTIWAFLGLQLVLPIAVRGALERLLRARAKMRAVARLNRSFVQTIAVPFVEFLRLKDRQGKVVATGVYSIGLIAFVWNTYQNQLPHIVVPFNFWDSKTYTWGFWITRVYKLYLFGWLLPYVALMHIGILVVTLRAIRWARGKGRLKLLPFHPDGSGGLGFVPSLVTTPIVIVLLIASIPLAGAFEIHRALDVTPLLGLAIIVCTAIVAYLVPILYLRSDIVALKQDTIGRLRAERQAYYAKIMAQRELDSEALRRGNEALDYFEKVCGHVQRISNYPHLRRLLGYLGVAVTPAVLMLAFKLFDELRPFIDHPLLKTP